MTVPLPRLVPVPALDPPYDDELPERPARPSTQGALALAFTAPTDARPPLLRVVDTAAATSATRPLLPDPRGWAARLLQVAFEVLQGQRAAAQLTRWTSPQVYAQLAGHARRQPRCGQQTGRALVRSVHVCTPREGVAEVSALIRSGTRLRAVALRLEARRGHWCCTALELG